MAETQGQQKAKRRGMRFKRIEAASDIVSGSETHDKVKGVLDLVNLVHGVVFRQGSYASHVKIRKIKGLTMPDTSDVSETQPLDVITYSLLRAEIQRFEKGEMTVLSPEESALANDAELVKIRAAKKRAKSMIGRFPAP